MTANVVFKFGPYTIDPAAYRLTQGETPIQTSPKGLDLLLLFVKQPGLLLTKDEIFRRLWPDVAVTDNALTQVVSELRQALGDSPASPTYLQTVARRGYRFIAPVELASAAPAAADAPASMPVARQSGQRAILVLDFLNVPGDPEMAWLASGIAETITNDLRAIRDLRVLDRALLPRGAGAPGEAGLGDALAAAAKSATVDLAVVGSFQRSKDRIRITARVVDVPTREALAHAKADGLLADVFALQDAIVTQLSAGLKITLTKPASMRITARETSSLDAYRALTEGRLKLETLDPSQVPEAQQLFETAIAQDDGYALAHVGLAHAHFWRFQASRVQNKPERAELNAAIQSARRAIEIDPELAEAHSALAFFLASADRSREAIEAGRLAVAIEPGNWRHQFRLGVAVWGSERLAAIDAVLAWYPKMTYAHFTAAMVHIARGDLAAASELLDTAIAREAEAAGGPRRFPASGLHWLRGLIHLTQNAPDRARGEFERELAGAREHLFAAEFAMDALDGLGFLALAAGDAPAARALFERALAHVPSHARSLVGVAAACDRLNDAKGAATARSRADAAITELRAHGRLAEAAVAQALAHAGAGRAADALVALDALFDPAMPPIAGWTVPIEPLLRGLHTQPAFSDVLRKLRQRAD